LIAGKNKFREVRVKSKALDFGNPITLLEGNRFLLENNEEDFLWINKTHNKK